MFSVRPSFTSRLFYQLLTALRVLQKMILVKFGYSDLVEAFLCSIHSYEVAN